MSQENVDFVRASFSVWNTGDMEAYGELLDPGIVSQPPREWPEPGPFRGREAVLREFVHVREAWDADISEPVSDFFDAGERVVVRLVWRGEGRGPAIPLEMSCIYTVGEGRMQKMEFFLDHAEALEAVGLSE